MKWNVVFEDYETGKLKLFNVFDDIGFRLDVEEIFSEMSSISPRRYYVA